MEPSGRKEKSKVKEPVNRVEKARQRSAQQELKQRQRAEFHDVFCWNHLKEFSQTTSNPSIGLPPSKIYALNRVMTELEQQQFDEFCKQMQPPRE